MTSKSSMKSKLIQIFLFIVGVVLIFNFMTSLYKVFNEFDTGDFPYQSAQNNMKNHLVGKWMGERQDETKITTWLVDRNPSGTQNIYFYEENLETGVVTRTLEVLKWGFSGGVYFTILQKKTRSNAADYTDMEFVDQGDAFYQDAYRVLHIGENLFEYEHIQYGRDYIINRISEDSFEDNLQRLGFKEY